MNESTVARLLQSIGELEDFFLEEAEGADIALLKATRRKRFAKYGAYGAAGLAVSAGMFVAYWKLLRPSRVASSA